MIRNGYATLAEVKADNRITSTDTADDAVIEALIENSSRLIDQLTGRRFYPRIQTRLYDMPFGLELRLDYDLLSLTTLTNGDATVITASEYTTRPREDTPIWAIVLKPTASITFEPDDDSNTEAAISVLGIWGYHTDYAQAWATGSTLSAAIVSTSATSVSVTSATPFSVGHIIKVDSEYMLVTAVSTGLTVERGWNGSTAATHLNGATVTIWRTQGEINNACRMIANAVYHNRFGNNPTGQVNITGAGVVISPQDVPATAAKVLDVLMLKGW